MITGKALRSRQRLKQQGNLSILERLGQRLPSEESIRGWFGTPDLETPEGQREESFYRAAEELSPLMSFALGKLGGRAIPGTEKAIGIEGTCPRKQIPFSYARCGL